MRTAYLVGKVILGALGPAAIGLTLISMGKTGENDLMVAGGLFATLVGGALSGWFIVGPALIELLEVVTGTDPVRSRDEWDD